MRKILFPLAICLSFSAFAQDWANTTGLVDLPQQAIKQYSTAVSLDNSGQFLLPAQAFKVAVDSSETRATINFIPAPGHYLYKDKISILYNNEKLKYDMPQSERKEDPNFGQVEVYHNPIALSIEKYPNFTVSYQGCSSAGVCYMPEVKNYELLDGQYVLKDNRERLSEAVASDNKFAKIFEENLLYIFIIFLFLGLALSFTPCVLPMIPILSSILIQKNKPKYGFLLSLSYVLGICFTYTCLGIFASMSGTLISNYLQNIWVVGSFSILFLLLGISMFGFYQIKLPQTWEDFIIHKSQKYIGGNFFSLFIMGALSSLVLSPCIAAPMAGVLLYISTTQNIFLGATALFSMALGMGIPLLLIGVFSQKILPKAGAWMEGVKKFFGLVLILMSVWFVEPFLPRIVAVTLWALCLFVFAMFFWDKKRYYFRAISVLFILIGSLMVIKFNTQNTIPSVYDARVYNISELKREINNSDKPVIVDLWAQWCVACREMEQFTFSNTAIQDKLKNYKFIKVDVTKTDNSKELLSELGLFAPPGLVFYSKEGEKTGKKIIGFVSADKLLKDLN